jgi:hypothetical protein
MFPDTLSREKRLNKALHTMKEFDALIAEARQQGKNAGLKHSDITDAVAKVRGRK